jgi:CBS domain-containing protein
MDNQTSSLVGDLMTDSIDTISPEEPVTVARRRMESQTSRSLIVVEGDRPVGVVQWRGLSGADSSASVRDVMQTEIPILRSDMPVDEVRTYLASADVDLDHLPVVDGNGLFVGEVPRGVITKGETTTVAATEAVISGPDADRDDSPVYRLEQGMKVVGAAGKNLGTVDEVDLNTEGRIAHFAVKHGFLGRKAKRLPADVIARVQGDEVHLNIDQMEFKMLADIGETVV